MVAEGHLRPHVAPGTHARLCEALTGLYSRAVQALPPAGHRPQGWSDVIEAFAARLSRASLEPPRQARELAEHSAKRLFDTLPIHISLRALDEEVVYGAVRFRMIAVSQDMQRRFALAELAKGLLAPL
jgi:hypothetical protein